MFRTVTPLGGPAAGAMIGLLLLAAAPPARGEMLLLGIAPQTPPIHLALDHGARLVATSRGGQAIVRGERAALFWPMLRGGVLAVAAPRLGCGGGR